MLKRRGNQIIKNAQLKSEKGEKEGEDKKERINLTNWKWNKLKMGQRPIHKTQHYKDSRRQRRRKSGWPCVLNEFLNTTPKAWPMKEKLDKLDCIKTKIRASLVVQWLRIRLPVQGTQVGALVWEDPTCHGATKPVCHNYWACALEPASHDYWAREPQLLSPCATTTEAHAPRAHAPQQEKPLQWDACTPERTVAPAHRN